MSDHRPNENAWYKQPQNFLCQKLKRNAKTFKTHAINGDQATLGWRTRRWLTWPPPPSLGILYLLCSFVLNVCFVHFQNSRWIWLPPILIPLQYLCTRKHQGKPLEEGKFHWLVVNCTRFSTCTNFCFFFLYMLSTFLLPCSDLCHAGQFLDMFKMVADEADFNSSCGDDDDGAFVEEEQHMYSLIDGQWRRHRWE